jgi:hypothetical protein
VRKLGERKRGGKEGTHRLQEDMDTETDPDGHTDTQICKCRFMTNIFRPRDMHYANAL